LTRNQGDTNQIGYNMYQEWTTSGCHNECWIVNQMDLDNLEGLWRDC